ncbi:MAG: bifunctional folylpolyglutamate synthase/dihydrofolate synthase [Firmicutes bacterium]|nr:bifunctional folylpolyglutamate synthase/dihydrofolate synthase [Bacillota bacterium]
MFKHLDEAIYWIETQVKFKPKTDLDRMRSAYQKLGIDLSHVKKIHVAGTNGKGSVCAFISNILIEAGYKVGTYTSPYLLKFHERIKYQFVDIKDDELLELVEFIYDFNQSFHESYGETLSFFELLTLMSLIYFSKKEVDVIVMEVGLGGSLDATSILDYDLSIITSIGFDHMKQLGNTLESIASNKLGIVKKNHHLITTVDPSLHHYFKSYIKDVEATADYYTIKDLKKISDIPLILEIDEHQYLLALIGEYQLLNCLISVKAVRYLYPHMDDSIIQKGLLKTRWAGRLEEIDHHIYLDGGHNTHAIDALKATALETFKDKKIWILFSALGDKDITGMIEILESFADKIVLTKFPDPRFQELSLHLNHQITYVDDALAAIATLKKQMDEDTLLIITGSLHFVGYIKNKYQKSS